MRHSMKPDSSLISIKDNERKIREFLLEVILKPRSKMFKWSRITNQTPNLKIGYPGQHLASLITGIQGTATGARGEDIKDGTEVKSCSRLDHVDTCKSCKSHVMRIQDVCPNCGSKDIFRQNDSKWLFTIHTEAELNMYLQEIPRTLLLIADYPGFDVGDFTTLRFATYEIWNQSERASNFRTLLSDYYQKIFLPHIDANPQGTPAPKNFWPYSFQFYLCNPIKTFECIVRNSDTTPKLDITRYVAPDADRAELPSENLPVCLLNKIERTLLQRHGYDLENCAGLDEAAKRLLPLRDTSEAHPQKKKYTRRRKTRSGKPQIQ